MILVGEDPASQVYVKHKVNDCETSGVRSVLDRYPASLSEAALLARIEAATQVPTAIMESPRGFNDATLGAFADGPGEEAGEQREP